MVAAVKGNWRVKREKNYDGEDEGEVLWYFMEVFGTEDCEEGATVTTVTFDGDAKLAWMFKKPKERQRAMRSTKKTLGWRFFFRNFRRSHI